ncbi:MAG: sugar ABC transporter permease [Chloroflexota bacterium]
MRSRKRLHWFIPVFLAPALVPYVVFFLYPAARALYISLFEWTGFGTDKKFVGLANYNRLAIDTVFWRALKNNVFAVVFGGSVVIFLALFFAILLSRLGRHSNLLKTVIVGPYTLSSVAVATIWKFLLDPQLGPINALLRSIGLGNLARPWLGDLHTVFPAVLVALIWWWLGFYMLILGAAISRIPSDIYEAAKVDGATEWQVATRITIPLIWDVLTVVAVLWIIDALRMFALVWAMTMGGPANASQVLVTYLYQLAFGGRYALLAMGRATAIGVVVFALVFAFSAIYRRVARRETYEY